MEGGSRSVSERARSKRAHTHTEERRRGAVEWCDVMCFSVPLISGHCFVSLIMMFVVYRVPLCARVLYLFLCCVFDVAGSLCLCSLLIVLTRPCISARHVNLAFINQAASRKRLQPKQSSRHYETRNVRTMKPFPTVRAAHPRGYFFYLKEIYPE